MKINPYDSIFQQQMGRMGQSKAEPASEGFTEYLNKSINEVNDLLGSADQKAQDLVSGKAESLHESMIAMEKADTALKLFVQVRNKALEAYNQIIQMQV